MSRPRAVPGGGERCDSSVAQFLLGLPGDHQGVANAGAVIVNTLER
jgi:hypothetical protein